MIVVFPMPEKRKSTAYVVGRGRSWQQAKTVENLNQSQFWPIYGPSTPYQKVSSFL